MKEISDKQVLDVFKEYPPKYRKKLLLLRKFVLSAAGEIPQGEVLLETIKWGEPSYLFGKRKIGTTIRIHWLKSKPDQFGIYFNCRTNLVDRFKKKFGKKFNYEGNRAIIFTIDDKLHIKELKECIYMALTYYL